MLVQRGPCPSWCCWAELWLFKQTPQQLVYEMCTSATHNSDIRMLFLIQGPYVTWQTSFLPVLQFSPAIIIPPLLHTNIQFTYNLARSEMSLNRTPLSVTSGFQSADVSSASQFRVAIHADTQFRRIRTSKDKTSLIIREVRRGSFSRQCTSAVHKSSPYCLHLNR